MRTDEVAAFLEKNDLPKRLQEFKGSSLLWYALFSNSVDYYYKVVYKEQPSKVSQAVMQLCELFKSRGMFVDLFGKKEVVKMTIQEFSREKELLYAGREEGFEEGHEEGLEKGIYILIGTLHELGFSKSEIVNKVSQKYGMSVFQAKNYVNGHFS